MLVRKPCHAGLKPRSRFFGLEPIDILTLAPGFHLCSVVLGRPVVAVGVTVACGVALRLLKWGRLPGYSMALLMYLLLPAHAGVFGEDRGAPGFPRSGRSP